MLELSALNCVRSKSFQNSDALTIICNKLFATVVVTNNKTPLYSNTQMRIAFKEMALKLELNGLSPFLSL